MRITAVEYSMGYCLDEMWFCSGKYSTYEIEINPSSITKKKFIGRREIKYFTRVKTVSKFLKIFHWMEYNVVVETETTPPLYVYTLSNGHKIFTEEDITLPK